eukprot:1159940-Pelagomonas_calceolata.AAC.6
MATIDVPQVVITAVPEAFLLLYQMPIACVSGCPSPASPRVTLPLQVVNTAVPKAFLLLYQMPIACVSGWSTLPSLRPSCCYIRCPLPASPRVTLPLQVVITAVPEAFLLPEFFRPGSGSQVVGTINRHTLTFKCPPKPTTKVGDHQRLHLTMTAEWWAPSIATP